MTTTYTISRKALKGKDYKQAVKAKSGISDKPKCLSKLVPVIRQAHRTK